MKPIRLTFKRHAKETGLARIRHPYPPVDIKLGGAVIGMIDGPQWGSPDERWRVRLKVIAASAECGWRWLTDMVTHETEAAARQWVTDNQIQIVYGTLPGLFIGAKHR